MNSDPTRKQLWEKAVRTTLNNRAHKIGGEKYVLLRSGQLVGAALCIFVRQSVLSKIKNVEGSVKKTGLSGMAGNKGAVAIRLDYANTHICFVTAHLAAGFANYDERNKDYSTISNGLRFQRNRGIDHHGLFTSPAEGGNRVANLSTDTVIWLGDFNYRIGLGWEKAMDLVKKRDLESLYANDQLNLQMVAGLSFPFYSEARITFMPTYKFDIGTDTYDSSEKARIPAWTDRILRKGPNLRQLAYNCAPLKFSDHRPVYALFDCNVSIVDEPLRDRISRDVYLRRKSEVGDATANMDLLDTEDEDLIGYDAIEPGLPPASSDRQKWWLENGKQAHSNISPPQSMDGSTSTILNPNRQPNPFMPSDEPDWVTVPRADSRLSSWSNISTSPYEHINHSTLLPSLSTSSNTPPHRKLPPPYDPSTLPARVGRLAPNEDSQHPLQFKKIEAPPAPPPRRSNAQAPSFPPPPNQTPVPSVFSQAKRQILPPPPPSQTPVPVASSQEKRQVLPPPPSRSVSSTSANSQHTFKGPPPTVAKKPSHLLSTSPTPPELETFSNTEAKAKPIPPRRPSSSVQGASRSGIQEGLYRTTSAREAHQQPMLPPPRRAGTASIASSSNTGWGPPGAVGLVGLSKQDRPSLPARKPVPANSPINTSGFSLPVPAPKKPGLKPKSPVVDLLGDDGATIGSWEALKPS